MDKPSLRADLKASRLKLKAADIQALSHGIARRCFGILSPLSISSLHIYLPKKRLNEIDTWPLIKMLQEEFTDIKIAYTPFDRSLTNPESLWLETRKTVLDSFQFDVIVIPLLGFDNQGYRLGYGSGFYDKFLVRQNTALKVGLCFEFGHLEALPHELHDMPLSIVITETNMLKFKQQ